MKLIGDGCAGDGEHRARLHAEAEWKAIYQNGNGDIAEGLHHHIGECQFLLRTAGGRSGIFRLRDRIARGGRGGG